MQQSQLARKTGVASLSVASNTILVILKLIVGIQIGAVSIISESLHSGVDLVAAIIALLAVRASAQEPDEEHPYGHGKYENISGAIEALLIFGAAAWIIYEAIHKLLKPAPLETLGWGMLVMLVSSVANIIVSTQLFRVARDTDSLALEADAWHLRTDVYTSAGVLLGLSVIWIGRILAPGVHLEWLDPVAAITVAFLIIKAAWDLTAKSVSGLLDTRLDPEELDWIRHHLETLQPQVCGVHHLRTRKSGATRFVDLHLVVQCEMPLVEAHALNDAISAAIHEHFPDTRVLIHTEPCEDKCDEVCLAGCFDRRKVSQPNQEPEPLLP
ncbi:MAG: cation diffusion facilitator family transporter [Armatimonadia bacterium]